MGIMTEPITTALIVGLAAQKFAEGAAGKSAEKLVEKLWDTIVSRFSGRKKTEENLVTIAAAKGQDVGAIGKVATVLDGEFVEDEDFEERLKAIVREIQAKAPERSQDVLVGLKGRNIKAKDVSAESQSGEAVRQRVAIDLEATEDIDLGNVSAKQ